MYLFKFYNKPYCFVTPELCKALSETILTTSEYCIFINNIEKFSYIKDVTKEEIKNLNSINSQLIRLNILNKKGNLLHPKNRYYRMSNVFSRSQPIKLNSTFFKSLCNKSHEEFKKELASIKEKVVKIKKVTIKKPLNPKDYNPSFHETYVYSDANWSPKDASL